MQYVLRGLSIKFQILTRISDSPINYNYRKPFRAGTGCILNDNNSCYTSLYDDSAVNWLMQKKDMMIEYNQKKVAFDQTSNFDKGGIE